MTTIFESAMRGYEMMDSVIKEHRGYQAARKEFGDGPASDPDLFGKLRQDRRAEEGLELRKRADQRAARQDVRQQESHDFSMGDAQSKQDEQGLLNFVQGLRKARDNKEDLGIAFDNLSQILPKLGIEENDIAGMRAELLENPALLDQIYESLADGQNARPRASAGSANKASMQYAKAENEIMKFGDALRRIDKLMDPKRAPAGKAIFGMPGTGKVGQGGFGMLGSIPGSAAADYTNDFEAFFEGDIRAIAFETLKGGGQITEKESEFARDAISRVKRSVSWDAYQTELKEVQAYLTRLQDAAYRRLNGERVPELTNDDMNYETGKGERIIFIGWVDPRTKRRFLGGDPNVDENWSAPIE